MKRRVLGLLMTAMPALAQEPLHTTQVAAIDQAITGALAEQKMPGCVVAIGKPGQALWLKAYGYRQLEPTRLPMQTNTVFDLASLTKPIATACSILQLVERGQLQLNDPVAKHLPAFGAAGKQAVTIRHLLLHTSGLAPANAMGDYADGAEAALQRIFTAPARYELGAYHYSDLGFIVLAEVLRARTGERLDARSARELFAPLGMRDTHFLPGPALRARCAATQGVPGTVHDPRAAGLGGVAGNAGLFSTATDLARFASSLLGEGRAVLRPETVALMTTSHLVGPGRYRTLGWDGKSGSSNRSPHYSDTAFGHGGFTGTALWIDPEQKGFVIFLSNRVHPDGKGSVNPLIGKIGSIAVGASR